MKDLVRQLESLLDKPSSEFHSCFRETGLALRAASLQGHYDSQELVGIPSHLLPSVEFRSLAFERLTDLDGSLVDILLSPKSAQLLWQLYCSPMSDELTILTKLLPSLAAIAGVVRGGPNIYKLAGWIPHVLVGYSVVRDYIPAGCLPPVIKWHPEVLRFVTEMLKPIIDMLEPPDLMLLSTAMLGHDIGVKTQIADHEVHGQPLVPNYLRELHITQNVLDEVCGGVELTDFTWAVQAIVRFHALVNRIGVEYSRTRSRNELADLIESARSSKWRTHFVNKKLAAMLLLIAVGDLVAVDDELLSERQVSHIKTGYYMLSELLNALPETSDKASAGIVRFRAFLGDGKHDISQRELDQVLSTWGFVPSDFWTKFYDVQEFNFTLSLVPHLPTALDTLLSFVMVFLFIERCLGHSIETYEGIRVVFEPKIEHRLLEAQLMRLGSPEVVRQQLSEITDNTWFLDLLRLSLNTGASGYTATVSAHSPEST